MDPLSPEETLELRQQLRTAIYDISRILRSHPHDEPLKTMRADIRQMLYEVRKRAGME